ncbi:MAG: HalOD1 output domain-containing protein [Halobellus sp.]|uniref:HalOD1 output domain-containing protein n=1 Tax=Halobellus sp. TaxID=1979212 RepID=UPI0035D52143
MTNQTGDPGPEGLSEWRRVGYHDFDGPDELDATLAAALVDSEGSWDESPLYDAVETEPAERFLASVNDDDASVIFSVADRTVRVSADGTVEVRSMGSES